MTIVQIIVLAIVQGFTEFLPISSSGHLVLTPVVFGWPDQGSRSTWPCTWARWPE